MISVQTPPFMNHPLHVYNPMSTPNFFNGMSAISKPVSQSIDNKPKASSPGAKRRPSRAGTRSVATLTAAQLERKRANDREAQRAIRQRTKDHIESLERRIAELTSASDVNARLAQALQRAEELEQENKILRSRLNQAVTAMAEGTPISPEMLTGPTSPSRRLRITTRSSSVPTVPRSIPNAIIAPSMSHQDHWNQGFTHSPVSSGVDRSPSLADVSPISTTMRWGPHAQPSPALSDSGNGVDPNSGCPQPSPVNYHYILDNGRALSYSPAADGGLMQQYSTQANGGDQVHAYAPHSGPQMSQPIQSPAYTQYPATPQSFIATSPHETDANLHLMSQQSPIEAQPIMYSMPTSIKEE